MMEKIKYDEPIWEGGTWKFTRLKASFLPNGKEVECPKRMIGLRIPGCPTYIIAEPVIRAMYDMITAEDFQTTEEVPWHSEGKTLEEIKSNTDARSN